MSDLRFLQKFLETNKLEPDSVYYFDPPLDDAEMYALNSVFSNVRHNETVLNPITYPSSKPEYNKLLWIETDGGGNISGWQNIDEEWEDDGGRYVLNDYESIRRWFKNNQDYVNEFIDGRIFLNNVSSFDLFDKLYESHNLDGFKRFFDQGELDPRTVYYFIPPVTGDEITLLNKILTNVDRYHILSNNTSDVEREGLMWFRTNDKGNVCGKQSTVKRFKTLKDIINFYENGALRNTVDNYVNGRVLLNDMPSSEDMFNKLYENVIIEVGSKRAQDTDIIYRDSNMIVVVPLSYESAKSYSRGTQYCTGGNCGNASEKTMQSMYKDHTEKGDILYRLIFKDGTKVRLTWNGNMNTKDFHWGLGKKDSYPAFTSRNMNNPFDLDKITNAREEQLIIKNQREPREKKFKEWEEKFFKKYESDSLWGVIDSIKEKYRVPSVFNDYGPMEPEELKAYKFEEKKAYNTYQKNKNRILGKWVNETYWWHDTHEMLYRAIKNVPNEAMRKMVDYAKSGSYKPKVNESDEDDNLEWARDVISSYTYMNIPKLDLEGKAWSIELNGEEEDFIEVQNWLKYVNNFNWGGGDYILTYERHAEHSTEGDIIYEIGSIFDDNIEGKTLTYSTNPNSIETSIRIAKTHSGKDVLFVYNWEDLKRGNLTPKQIPLKNINESEEDEFSWVTDLGLPSDIDHSTLMKMGNFKLKPLNINELRPGMFIKRRSGMFLYEIGEPSARTFRDRNSRQMHTDAEGFILKNLSNGKEYFSLKTQIIREFFEIISKNINESEDDSLDWAREIIKEMSDVICDVYQSSGFTEEPEPIDSCSSWIEAINEWNLNHGTKGGTIIYKMDGTTSPHYKLKFHLIRGGYVQLGSDRSDSTVTYIVDDVSKLSTQWEGHMGAWATVEKFLLSLQVRMPLQESEDDSLEWAQEAANNPVFVFKNIMNDLEVGDIISITGDIEDGERNILTTLKDEPFGIDDIMLNREGKHKASIFRVVWLNPRNLRPSNWEEPSSFGSNPIYDNIALNPFDYYADGELGIKIIEKANHPF